MRPLIVVLTTLTIANVALAADQHLITGNVGTGLDLAPSFDRFAVNAGRCAWNLILYGDLLAAALFAHSHTARQSHI